MLFIIQQIFIKIKTWLNYLHIINFKQIRLSLYYLKNLLLCFQYISRICIDTLLNRSRSNNKTKLKY